MTTKRRTKVQEPVDPSDFYRIDLHKTQNCGIREMNGIQNVDPSEVILSVAQQIDKPAFLTFSAMRKQRGSRSRLSNEGLKLAAFIREHRLGSTSTLPPEVNPNTGNTIQMWIWRPNVKNIQSFLNKAQDAYEEFIDKRDSSCKVDGYRL